MKYRITIIVDVSAPSPAVARAVAMAHAAKLHDTETRGQDQVFGAYAAITNSVQISEVRGPRVRAESEAEPGSDPLRRLLGTTGEN